MRILPFMATHASSTNWPYGHNPSSMKCTYWKVLVVGLLLLSGCATPSPDRSVVAVPLRWDPPRADGVRLAVFSLEGGIRFVPPARRWRDYALLVLCSEGQRTWVQHTLSAQLDSLWGDRWQQGQDRSSGFGGYMGIDGYEASILSPLTMPASDTPFRMRLPSYNENGGWQVDSVGRGPEVWFTGRSLLLSAPVLGRDTLRLERLDVAAYDRELYHNNSQVCVKSLRDGGIAYRKGRWSGEDAARGQRRAGP